MDIGDRVIFKKHMRSYATVYTIVGTLADDKVQLEHPYHKYTTSWIDKKDLWLRESFQPAGKSL